ncbi:MAG: D-glycero-beta-D-manno-heptose 1-phosphate adenylyltransferase [Blastocatellia bacterium]|nr:D-glycero-beta-D-manno-heptose 1-phosphate adenylyltransferase [Blastocatellia bacterium]
MGEVLSLKQMLSERERLRSQKRKVVFTNGCFDLIHPGHVRILREARSLGDALIVAINSDRSVRELKGPNRPILNENERAEVLAALACVDYVITFDDVLPRETIKAIRPDVLVKGGDYTPDTIVGRAEVEAQGGEVKSLSYIEGFSTSDLIERIRKLKVDKA